MVNRSNELRQNNREIILREILRHEQISRQEIIEKTGLAPSTVSSITKEILEEKIIRKSGQLNSQGTGRKTDLFMRNGDHAQILVINLTFESNKIALVDLELNIRSESDIVISNFTTESVAETLQNEIKAYLADNRHFIQSIVLALPHYPYEKEKIKELLNHEFNIPVFTINNVEAMGMYDSQYLHSQSSSLVYIFVGKGIGSAFFNKGELLVGENGYASDLGHIHITDQPIECRCGRSGCLETVASEDSLIQAIMDAGKLPEKLTGDDLIQFMQKAIDGRDENIQEIVSKAASFLAESILTIISLLDPQTIILTGRITALNPFLSQKLEEYLYSKSGRRSLYSNKLIYQEYRPKSTAKGAALYALLSAYGGLNK
jgi:N-acetylglucosamine repressor